jgi:ABC-type uncharacterized transport system permease subunit
MIPAERADARLLGLMMAGDWAAPRDRAGDPEAEPMRFERREQPRSALTVLAPLGAILAALVVAGVLIAIAGANAFEAFGLILKGAFGSRLGITETLTRATPLILTGLAAAVAFRARLWNIGGEGQFYMGALAITAFGLLPGIAARPRVWPSCSVSWSGRWRGGAAAGAGGV